MVRKIRVTDTTNFVHFELMSARGTADATVEWQPDERNWFRPSVHVVLDALCSLVVGEAVKGRELAFEIDWRPCPMGDHEHTQEVVRAIETWRSVRGVRLSDC